MFQRWPIGLLFFLASCSLIEPGGQDILTLNKDFELRLFERIEPGVRQLELHVLTVEAQPCENAEIALTTQQSPNSFKLRLEDIIAPDESRCIKKETIIQNEVHLPQFTGRIDLVVQIRDIVEHRGNLNSDPTSASFLLIDTEGLEISRDNLFKIPQKLVWGSLSTYDPAKETALLELFATMESQCQQAVLTPGYYSYFDIGPGGDPTYLFGENAPVWRDFVLSYEGDPRTLFDLLEPFRDPAIEADIRSSSGWKF